MDYHPTSTLWWCLGIMILAAVDAAMMLYFHDLGFQQQNGFVATLIDSGRGVYLAVKMLGTGAALMMLAAASSLVVYRVLPARYLFPIVFFGYLVYVLNLLRYFL